MPTSSAPLVPPSVVDSRDATALRFVAALALTASAVWATAAVLAAVLPLFGGEPVEVELLAAGAVTVGGADGIPPLITQSYLVLLDAGDVSGGAFGLLLAEAGLTNLVGAVVAGVIAFALRAIARGDAFHRAMPALMVAVGSALAIGMLTASALGGFGRMMAADELNAAAGAEDLAVGFTFDPVPVLVGVAVLALAFGFRAGARLQRETAGLV